MLLLHLLHLILALLLRHRERCFTCGRLVTRLNSIWLVGLFDGSQELVLAIDDEVFLLGRLLGQGFIFTLGQIRYQLFLYHLRDHDWPSQCLLLIIGLLPFFWLLFLILCGIVGLEFAFCLNFDLAVFTLLRRLMCLRGACLLAFLCLWLLFLLLPCLSLFCARLFLL